jgi:WD40 repeat protein
VGPITDLAFSPDGALVATASTDGPARVWRTGKGLEAVLIGHALGVGSVTFSGDSSSIATTSEDGTARLWAVNGRQIAVLAGHRAPVRSVAWSGDGRAVVTTGADGALRRLDALAEPVLGLVRQESYAVAAARSATGGRIVVAPRGAVDVSVARGRYATAAGKRVDVRRVADGALVASFRSRTRVTGVALSPDASTVAVATADGSVRLQRIGGGLVRILQAPHALTRVAFSADGRLVAAGSKDHAAYVWKSSGGASRVFGGHTDTVNSARFDSTGSLLVTASRDHHVRVWDVASRRMIRLLSAHFGSVADAGFSPDGRWIVTAGPGKAGLFDLENGELLSFLQRHHGPLTSASFAGDGRTIVTSGSDGSVRVYRCDVCAPQAGLMRLADTRLAATGRTVTKPELAALGL